MHNPQLRTRGTSVLCLAAALGLALAAPARAEKNGRFAAGAPGIGDAYYPLYGNGGYDVAHYDLAVRYDPATDLLTGVATISATATQDLSGFNLDLTGLTVRSIAVDGKRARWMRTEHELVIIPQRKLKRGEAFTTVVRYDGVPHKFVIPIAPGVQLESGFIATDDGALVAGQPEVATAWFPVNDDPLDKATYSFHVTAPAGLQVLANGLPAGSSTTDGWSTTTWEARTPMASYLATIDIGKFDVHSWMTADGLPVIDAVDPDLTGQLRANIDASLARQGEVLVVLEGHFGPYPFDTVGAIVDDYPILFALENQTRPVYSWLFWLDGPADFVVIHELAHQWFGDHVALGRWQDIWLNEGFATYAEWLWMEYEGIASVQDTFDELFATPEDDPSVWGLAIGDPGVQRLLDDPVYVRGGLTVHALRMTIGDPAFFTLLHRWIAEHGGGNGTTPQFIALAEEVAGMNLGAFFDAWLFQADKPPAPTGASARLRAAQRTSEIDGPGQRWLADLAKRRAQGMR